MMCQEKMSQLHFHVLEFLPNLKVVNSGGILWKNLRCQKQCRERYGKTDRLGIIPNLQSIDQRQAIVSLAVRKSEYMLIR